MNSTVNQLICGFVYLFMNIRNFIKILYRFSLPVKYPMFYCELRRHFERKIRITESKIICALYSVQCVRCLIIFGLTFGFDFSLKNFVFRYQFYYSLIMYFSVDNFSYIFLAHACIFFFGAFVMYYLYLSPDNIEKSGMHFVYDLVVRNCEQFWRENFQILNKHFNMNKLTKSPIYSLKCQWKFLKILLRNDAKLGFKSKLKNFPNLSNRIRLQSVAIVYVADCGIYVVLICLDIFNTILFLIYLIFMIYLHYHPLHLLLVLLDFYTNIYLYITLIKLVICITVSSNITFFVYCMYFRELNRLLERSIRNSKLRILHQITLTTLYRFFQYEHTEMTQKVLKAKPFWSRIIGLYTLTNIPINAYLVAHIWFYSSSKASSSSRDYNLPLIILIAFIQLAGGLLALHPIAQMSTALHSSSRYFVPMQFCLRNFLQTKWKLLAYYELVNCRRQLSYHNGPFGVITRKYIAKLVMSYLAYLTFSLKLNYHLKATN